jgi:two-component system, NarL family, sensor kinase
VAAYRIAVEALANAAKHSGARRCHLELTTNQMLRLIIADDGHGFNGQYRDGIGIRLMRERVQELGGSLAIDSDTGGGVRVVAELPTLQQR